MRPELTMSKSVRVNARLLFTSKSMPFKFKSDEETLPRHIEDLEVGVSHVLGTTSHGVQEVLCEID